MKYSFDRNDSSYILKIEGDLDLYSSYEVKEEIVSILKSEIKDVYIDLEHLNYIDSSGIGLIVDINKICIKNRKKCYLINVTNEIKELLKTLRIDKLFNVIE